MIRTARRSMSRGSRAVAAAGTLARRYIANAAGSTATVCLTRGFTRGGRGLRQVVTDHEKVSGKTIDYSVLYFPPLKKVETILAKYPIVQS